MGQVITVAIVSFVCLRAELAAPEPREVHPMQPEMARDEFRELATREHTLRREAAVKFPGDLWSQDDDFHERENEQVRAFARGHDVSVSSVVKAVDDGMRKRWPGSAQVQVTVPPCRPRLSY